MGAVIVGILALAFGTIMVVSDRFSIGGFLILVGSICVSAGFEHWRSWAVRPTMVCIRCTTKAEPGRRRQKRWNCSVCGSSYLVPVGSPIAMSILARSEESYFVRADY